MQLFLILRLILALLGGYGWPEQTDHRVLGTGADALSVWDYQFAEVCPKGPDYYGVTCAGYAEITRGINPDSDRMEVNISITF
jgi:hypothetical protein